MRLHACTHVHANAAKTYKHSDVCASANLCVRDPLNMYTYVSVPNEERVSMNILPLQLLHGIFYLE